MTLAAQYQTRGGVQKTSFSDLNGYHQRIRDVIGEGGLDQDATGANLSGGGVFPVLITQILITRTGGPRLILSSARTALARGVSGCSKRSEDENLYFVLFTQTEETGQNFGSCLPVDRGSGGASVSEVCELVL